MRATIFRVRASMATTSSVPVADAYTRDSSVTASTPCTDDTSPMRAVTCDARRSKTTISASPRDVKETAVRIDALVVEARCAARKWNIGHPLQREQGGRRTCGPQRTVRGEPG
ncbi:hypothetical protein AQ906_09765 [Burkholderia pseudomallei]|nr:hypothetical protein AQ906_09765 [Burkholderia pseudomallei]